MVCRKRRPQADLLRVRLTPNGDLVVGAGAVGRSAYCCDNQQCTRGLFEKDRLKRALKRPVSPEALLSLAQVLQGRQR
ncbi:MAG TPA: YlxR family protein [Fimbriimonadaceae bacterium]|nr:YlxR family protein [Fimbriimonadaceae bacterium]